MEIKKLIDKYHTNKANYTDSKYNETLLRSDFLDPLFELLGWDIKNTSGKPTNEREVILEEGLKENKSSNTKKPDYTFRLFSERKFFLEAKKPYVKIEADNETAKQVRRYGFTAKLKISVLSNFEYLMIYDTSVKVEKDDVFTKGLIKKYHYTEYAEKFEEIYTLLSKEVVYNGEFDKTWEFIETQLNQFSVDKLFLTQINKWRVELGKEIFNHNKTISEQELNDIVQSYINRIIFLRVCEDRNLEVYQTLLQLATNDDFNALIEKFTKADKKYNSGLFDQLLSNEIIKNVSSVFWKIIKQLYFPESPYSFSVFSSDILGNIYEIFLSEKLSIVAGTIQLIKKPENIDKDIVTTPTYIINDILRDTVIPKCNDKTAKEILGLKFADISCGSGAFLLELFQLLNDIVIDYYLKNDTSKLIQTNIDTYKLSFETKREILLNCVFGVDKDYNAVEASKFGLLLKLLEGEDVNSVNKSNPILPNLDNNIFFGNSLINSSEIKENKTLEIINPFDFQDLKFDVIIGNPPYLKVEDMKNITPVELPIYKENFKSAYKQFDKYFLFIEQGLNLLKEDGVLGYIVPSKFTKLGSGKNLRKLLAKNGNLKRIVSFGANQVFKDKTTYTCLLFTTKTSNETFTFTEVNNLTQWKIRDYNSLKFNHKKSGELSDEIWVLVNSDLENPYNNIVSQSTKLIDLVGGENVFNGIQTSANPIYIFTPIREDNIYYYFEKKGKEYKIEKTITKPYFQTSSGEDNLFTYRTFKPNARVIYPYVLNGSKVDLISLSGIKIKYKEAYKYLLEFKTVLNNPKRDIKPTPKTSNEWHRYGRHQSLDNCSLAEKLIVGVLSKGNKYAVDVFGTLISSGGTAGYCVVALPQNSDYNIYYIQALLNSKYLEWFCALYGEVFRGGYIARGTKVLNNLPIRIIDFKNKADKKIHDKIAQTQKKLIEINDKIELNSTNKRIVVPLKREFENLKNELDNTLKELYALGEDDKLIPLIQELYETN
ncbi:MAG: hypothetical protein RLZZ540_3344 [Bacteroidota bacterium]|jgi:hypothetical protein